MANLGCSCKKYRPPSICSWYKDTMKSMCTFAFRRAGINFSGSVALAALRCCQVLKCVHPGDPIRRYGFCSRKSFRARSRLCASEKSHGRPSYGSVTVKSSANPGIRCLKLRRLRCSSAVTRGGEYISDTTRRAAVRASRRYARPELPSCCSSISAVKSSADMARDCQGTHRASCNL